MKPMPLGLNGVTINAMQVIFNEVLNMQEIFDHGIALLLA